MVGEVSTSDMVLSSIVFVGLFGFGSSESMFSLTEAMVSPNSSLCYGESWSTLTSALGCGYGDAFIISLIGLVARWIDEMLESRKPDQ